MSASSRPVETPLAARPRARLTAVVDLPTPPLPEATAMMCFTPGMSRTACSQAWRRGSRAVPRGGSTWRVMATWPPRQAMPPTMPCATTLFAVAGSMTASRTLRTADSLISAINACFRGLAISCRRLIAGVAAVTYMQRDLKSKPTMRRARRQLALRWRWQSGRWRRAVRLAPATRYGRRDPQGPGAAEEPDPGRLRFLQGHRARRAGGLGDFACHPPLYGAAETASPPTR